MTSFDDVDPDVEAELASAFTDDEFDGDDGDDGADDGSTHTRTREPRRRVPRPDLIGWAKRSGRPTKKSAKKSTKKPTEKSSGKAKTPTATTGKSSGRSSGPAKKKVGGKTRFVISDDDRNASDRGTQAAPIGRSRFRERRIAVRRAAGRRRLRWVVVAGTAVAIALVVLLLLASPILSIRQVDVEGVVYADPERVGEVVASLKGDPILTADLSGAESDLEAIPWIKAARVSMHLPSRVRIQIAERTPMAFFRAVDGFNRVIDIDGRVLDVIEGDPVDYPPIRGTGPNLTPGDLVGQPFLGAVQLLNALPRDLRLRVIAAAASPEGELSLELTDGVTVLFGRPEGFQDKLVGVVNEIKRQGSRSYSVIDVSTGEPSVR
ncbi:MAG: putative cell division protein FtsQ [Actinomycetota bacterium]